MKIPSRNPDIKCTLLPDGHLVLFNSNTNWAHTLNPVGAIVWEYLDGQHTARDIIAEITELGDFPDIKEEDIIALLSEFQQLGLLQE